MEKIVEEVLKVEQQAQELVNNARDEAARLKSDVEQSIAEQLKDANAAAQQLIKEGIEKARATAEAELKTEVEKAKKANAVFLEENRGKIDNLIEQAVKLIATSELDRE